MLETASAGRPAARVAAGALAKQLLDPFGITVFGYVVEVGPIVVRSMPGTLAKQRTIRDQSALYTLNPVQDAEIIARIDQNGKRRGHFGRRD